MNLQNQILNNYFELFGKNRTLKEMSGHLDIQITRVFRILNGYEMKISEYEKIKNAVNSKRVRADKDLVDMALEGDKVFSVKISHDVKKYLDMKIRMKKVLGK